jgi:MoxR-like ATPase
MADLAEPGGVVVARREAGDWERFASSFSQVADNIRQVIQGKEQEVRLALVCLVAEGHLLIEDVPGVGKTMLAKSMARSIDCSFRRIQFTPDLLPTDVTGVNVYNQERVTSSSSPAPSSPTSSSGTRSTGPARRPSRPCSKAWRSAR